MVSNHGVVEKTAEFGMQMFTIFGQLTQQIMPNFVTQRSLYEVRERPSKTYSWKIFILSNIVSEIPWASKFPRFAYLCSL